jgi:hypothetical protein
MLLAAAAGLLLRWQQQPQALLVQVGCTGESRGVACCCWRLSGTVLQNFGLFVFDTGWQKTPNDSCTHVVCCGIFLSV